MTERKDYSGDYDPTASFEDFSKEALIRLIQAYQIIFVGYMGMWNTVNRQRMGVEEAWNLDSEVYEKQVSKFEIPLVCDAMNIRGNDVVSMLKYFQMCPDGAREGLYEFRQEILGPNHAVLTFTRCPTLFYFEKKNSLKDIECLCGPGGTEDRAFAAICKAFNPRMQSRALKIPPREGEEAICCQWEFKVEEPADP